MSGAMSLMTPARSFLRWRMVAPVCSDCALSGRKAAGPLSATNRSFIHSTFRGANLSSDGSRVERLDFLDSWGMPA